MRTDRSLGLALASTLIIISGCADTAKFLRSQPSSHFPTNSFATMPNEHGELLKIHCTHAEDVKHVETDASSQQCLYISADISKSVFVSSDIGTTRDITKALISISDLNCSTFLHRAFANRAGLDAGKKFFQDVSTALSAGTASVSAPLSAALDVTNLVVGKGVDTFNTTYYLDKTFQAMEASILAERARHRAYLDAKLAESNYSIRDAISDVRAYDDACSFKAGLYRLVNTAEKEKTNSEKSKLTVEAASSNKMTTFNNEFNK